MGLLGCVLDNGLALCHARRHHHIDRGANRNLIHENMVSGQMLCLCNDRAVYNAHIGAQRLKSFNMLINCTNTDVASARKRDFRMFVFSEKCADQIIRSPYPLHKLIFDHKIVNLRAVYLNSMPVDPGDHGPDT